MAEAVNHPAHYQAGGLEVIDIIELWGLDANFNLGNALKYILRHKAKGRPAEDLAKAQWYLKRSAEADRPFMRCRGARDSMIKQISTSFQLSIALERAIESIYLAANQSEDMQIGNLSIAYDAIDQHIRYNLVELVHA